MKKRAAILSLLLAGNLVAQDEETLQPIAIADITRDTPVDFGKEVYPLLKKNCLACHNSSTAKSKLNLESAKAMITGGNEGPAIEPGNGEGSLLMILASHSDDPVMPPEGNKANAEPFTPEELGLIKLWIDEGAKGEALIAMPAPERWLVPQGSDFPVYHTAISPNGRFAAAARANRIALYDLVHGTLVTELSDPAMGAEEAYRGQPAAHHDFVQSLAFSADGWLASGGFRTVKLWRPHDPARLQTLASLPEPITSLAVSPDGAWAAAGDAAGHVQLWKRGDHEHPVRMEKRHEGRITGLAFSPDQQRLLSAGEDQSLIAIELESGEPILRQEHPGAINAMVAWEKGIVTGDGEGTLRLWIWEEADTHTLTESKQWSGHQGPITALARLPHDPQGLVSSGEDGKARLWHLGEGAEKRAFDHGSPVATIAASPDGQRIVTFGGPAAKLWDLDGGGHVADLATDGAVHVHRKTREREAEVAGQLVEARKQQVTETENAWKAELEKAKTAAQEEVAARREREAKEGESSRLLLAHQDSEKRAGEARGNHEAAQAAVVSAEETVKDLDQRLEAEKPQVDSALAQLEEKRQALETERLRFEEPLAQAQERLDRWEKATQEVAGAFRQLQETAARLEEDDSKSPALASVEQWLADIGKHTTASRAARDELAAQRGSFSAQSEEIVSQKAATEAARQLLLDERNRAAEQVEAARQSVQTAAEQERQLVESAAKAAEEAMKAESAFDEADDALGKAAQNRELAIRLANRAAESHATAQAALADAETTLKQAQEAVEALAKTAEEAQKPIASAAFSADGKVLYLGDGEGSAHAWNAASGTYLETFMAPAQGTLLGLPDGGFLAAADRSLAELQVRHGWDHERTLGDQNDPTQFIDRVTALAFNSTGTLLATGTGFPSRSGEFKIWRVADGKLMLEKTEAHSDTIVGMAFSPDGQYLATAATDRFAKIFRVDDGSIVATFEGHTNHVLDVAWRADGRVLATAGADNVVKLWDFEEKRQIQTIDGYSQEITSIAFIGTSETLLTGSGDNTVRLGNDRLDNKAFVHGADVSDDGSIIVAGAQDNRLRVWSAGEKKLLFEFEATP